jgi:predicted O-methyltransferase YrrM
MATHITPIDQICDRAVRKPFEEVDLTLFDELQSGDFLFIDSSRRTFTNSDVTIIFMEILPRLHPAVVIYVDDIFWSNNHPSNWNDRDHS